MGPTDEDYVDVTLPSEFTFYTRTATVAHVYENGYITLGDSFGEAMENTGLPNPAAPNSALYPFWDNLEWDTITAESAQEDPQGTIYTAQVGDWFVIEYFHYYSSTSEGNPVRNLRGAAQPGDGRNSLPVPHALCGRGRGDDRVGKRAGD